MKFTRQFWFPGGLLLLSAAGVQLSTRAFTAVQPYLTTFCLLSLGGGVVLGWIYNRSRPVASLLVLGSVAWVLPALLHQGAPVWLLQTLAVLVPLNLILFALLPDQGLRAPTSMIAASVLVFEALSLPVLSRSAISWMELQLAWTPMPSSLFHWSWIGQPALIGFAVAGVLLGGIFAWRRRPTDRGMFWALVAAFIGVQVAEDPRIALLYFGSGALVLTLSLVEHAHAMAYVDALTGLASRRSLDEYLPQLHGRYALAIVDVDHFKRLNDAYGHSCGDQVLRKIATQLSSVGGRGRVFRHGGEEFAVVFPGRSRREALPHLESLRARIEATAFGLRGAFRPAKKPKDQEGFKPSGRKVHLTVSIGVAERSEKLGSPAMVIEAADRALYRAKASGRNQVFAA